MDDPSGSSTGDPSRKRFTKRCRKDECGIEHVDGQDADDDDAASSHRVERGPNPAMRMQTDEEEEEEQVAASKNGQFPKHVQNPENWNPPSV